METEEGWDGGGGEIRRQWVKEIEGLGNRESPRYGKRSPEMEENRETGLGKERDGEEDGEEETERKLEKGRDRDAERGRDTEDGNEGNRTGRAVTCS